MKNRVLCLILTAALMLSLFPAVSLAETETVQPETVKFNLFKNNYIRIYGSEITNTESEDGSIFLSKNTPLEFEIESRTGATPYTVWVKMKSKAPDCLPFKLSYSVNGAEKNKISASFLENSEYQWVFAGNLTINYATYEKIGITIDQDAVINSIVITSRQQYFPSDNDKEFEVTKMINSTFVKGMYPTPKIQPKKGTHPKVVINGEELKKVKKGLTKPQNLAAYNKYKELLSREEDGILPPGDSASANNADGELLSVFESCAFDYLLTGNEESAIRAKNGILNYLRTCNVQTGRTGTYILMVVSMVFDWTYDFFTEEEKEEFFFYTMSGVAQARITLNVDYLSSGYFTSGGSETHYLRDFLAFALAAYDDHPEIYEFIGGALFHEYYPARNYLLPAHTAFQGTSYTYVRDFSTIWSQVLIYRATGKKPMSDEMAYLPYDITYAGRSDDNYFREGDDEPEVLHGKPRTILSNYNALLISSLYKDPYLKREFLHRNRDGGMFGYDFSGVTPVMYLCINDPDVEPAALSDLPKSKYFPSPNGKMVARTGWDMGIDADEAVVSMKIGEKDTTNHQHNDSGTFQIYYNGYLTGDSSIYALYGTVNDFAWSKETIGHNGLLIYDPNEVSNQTPVVTGGMTRRSPNVMKLESLLTDTYTRAKVIGQEFGPDPIDPEYTYISGDLTPGYTENKVSEVRRSMMFMPTENKEAPAVFFVMDKIVSKNKSFKKSFLLHTMTEPAVEGNVTTIKRTEDGRNGKLTVQTLYPENPDIEIIGGVNRQWEIFGTNYPPGGDYNPKTIGQNLELGWGRIEIHPSEEAYEDYYLNAMYVSDADGSEEVYKAETIETDKLLGAKLLNKVSLFAKEKIREKGTLTFDIESEEKLDIAVTGIEKGEWKIYKDGKFLEKAVAGEDGGMIYFSSTGGSFKIVLTNKNAKKVLPKAELKQSEIPITIYFNGFPWYLKEPAEKKNGTLMAPYDVFKNAAQFEITTKENGNYVLKKGLRTLEFNLKSPKAVFTLGKEAPQNLTLTQVPYMKNGTLMLPVRFIIEQFAGTVDWYEMGKIAYINITSLFTGVDNTVPILDCTWSAATTTGFRAFDGDYSTRWSCAVNEETGPQWLRLVFDDVYEIEEIETVFFSGFDRTYTYEMWLSEDDVNWVKVVDDTTSGEDDFDVRKLEKPVRAKYAKLVGKGATSGWFTVNEMEFRCKIEKEE